MTVDEDGYNVVDSSTDKVNRKATINLDPGETVECTYTNRQRGMVDLLKLTNGVEDPNMMWNFTLTGPEVNVADSTPPTLMDFGGAKLIPGETYTLCESPIPAGYSLMWVLDVNADRVIDVPPDAILPFVGGEADLQGDGLLQVYDPDPNYGTPGTLVNDTKCVNFAVEAGETLSFIDRQPASRAVSRRPSATGRTGTPARVATSLRRPTTTAARKRAGTSWTMCCRHCWATCRSRHAMMVGTSSTSVISTGKQEAGERCGLQPGGAAARRQGQLDGRCGARAQPEPYATIAAADDLLSSIGFDGTGNVPAIARTALYGEANALATTLDEYNNGNLCP